MGRSSFPRRPTIRDGAAIPVQTVEAAASGGAPRLEAAPDRSLTRRLARVEADLAHFATDGLRPAALTTAILFVGFAAYTVLRFPVHARVPTLLYDAAIVVAAFVLHARCRRAILSPRAVHVAVTGLSLAIGGNVLMTAFMGANPVFSFCLAILLVASAGTVLSLGWAAVIAVAQIAGWAIGAFVLLPPTELPATAFLMASSLGVAFIVHVGRHIAMLRILEMRDEDARREVALQQALAQADEAHHELDRKVEQRTQALRTELEERERLEHQLRHAQKMEAVGRLAGGIAHDFNNLLTVIRMSLDTVGELEIPDDVRDALRDASDSTDRAAGLTRDLLAFARKQTLERASVTVADIVGGVERMVRRVAEAGIRIEVRIAPDAGDVIADRHQIEQVLLNLAINACDAMARHGTLTIAVDSVELAAAAAASYRLRPGMYVRFAVTDTGTGMDEATRRSVFEPFFTTKEVGRGTGLGLAVAHGIVTQHGGHIAVDSELGKGSTFTVFLPRSRTTSLSGVTPVMRPPTSSGHETVLVVEDEPAVRRGVQRNLERLGYHVIAAHDGEDALRVTESLDGIDLLLSDVVMPGIDGPELACRLRARWPTLPVLFVTGYSADRLARTGAVGPHDRVLEKPYELEQLATTIRGMLADAAACARATRK
ncbi:MAG TPA: ATP-binding protein [Kofleriaceae bacterium]|nr:ATP-binding protein [Kofleriaceae bacterium]